MWSLHRAISVSYSITVKLKLYLLSDTKTLMHLLLLPSLFKATSFPAIPEELIVDKKRWRPSIAETREGFILHSKVSSPLSFAFGWMLQNS